MKFTLNNKLVRFGLRQLKNAWADFESEKIKDTNKPWYY